MHLSFHKVKLEPEEDDTVQYICDNSNIKTVIESIGKIHASSTFASISFASGEGIHTARVKVETHFKLYTKDRRGARSMGGDRVLIQITQPDGSDLPCRIEDKGMLCQLAILTHRLCAPNLLTAICRAWHKWSVNS